jgi:transcription termination factor Rho
MPMWRCCIGNRPSGRLIVLRIGARPEEVTNTQRPVNVASLPLVP